MKRYLITLLILLVAESSSGQLTLGIKAGYNAAKLSTDVETIKTSFQSGFQAGAFLRYGKKIYLQPELYYTTQGGVFTSNISPDSLNKIRIGSIDIPVLIGLKIIRKEMFNVRIFVGPLVSFVTNKTIAEGGTSLNPITTADINSLNWALQAGAGIDIWKFTFDIRYQLGLNKLIKDIEYNNVDYSFNSYNSVWIISLGFTLFGDDKKEESK